MRRVRFAFLLLSAAALLAAVTVTAGAAIPKKATYVGRTSQKLVAAIFVSRNGTRVGFTIFVTARCTNGTTMTGLSWSTEGKWEKDYWIRPKANGSFASNDGNTFATTDGGQGRASAVFKGRFKTARLVAGTLRGHIEYRSAEGRVTYTCDTGLLTWTARR
jgi:hypothetical protein